MIEHLVVGTSVRIETGLWSGQETVITELIPDAGGDPAFMRYDVTYPPGRWYHREELTVVVSEDQEHRILCADVS